MTAGITNANIYTGVTGIFYSAVRKLFGCLYNIVDH